MKILRLSFLLFTSLAACLVGVGYAQDATKQDSQRAKADSDLLAAPVAGGAADRLILNMRSDVPDSLSSSCAYMRTYRVKRRARGSDAVGPAGYTTCVPMRRFEMRTTVETRTDSGGGRDK
jgi:hypothetical protein